MSRAERRPGTASADWDAHTLGYREASAGRWRAYCDEVHRRLLAEHLPVPGPTVLKTDLFDEAAGAGLVPGLAGSVGQVVGVDISTAVVAAAVDRNPRLLATVGDLRALPFGDAVVDTVVSNSSLDHFATRAELAAAAGELHRVVRPGGRLLVTLDNLACPVVALRAVLPYRLLHRLGVLPYPVGVTCTARGLRRLVRDHGFVVERTFTFMHVPRVVAVPLCARADRRSPSSTEPTVGRLLRWEFLDRLPTRRVTAHYIGVVAVRT